MIARLEPSLASDIRLALDEDTLGQEILTALNTHALRHPKVDLGVCSKDNDGLLLVNRLIYIPEDLSLRQRIISSRHSHPAAGHPGQAATFELVTRNFWWPGLRQTIARFIRNCETCQRIKPARHAPYGYLKPLEVPQRRWQSVSLDLITGLPTSNSFDAILVVVDRLTKMAHFIPCQTTLDSVELAKLYRDYVFRLHGLPDDFVSNRGSVFTSKFTRALSRSLSIKTNFSTAFHPQTDGQTERINAILEQYLRAYVSYQQDDWNDFLSLAEFAYNNTISTTTKVTPFFANYGFHPRYEILQKDTISAPLEPLRLFQENLENLENYLRQEIRFAQDAYAEQANKDRIAPPIFRPGDLVWLLRRHISTTRPSDKLDFKRLGPFSILEKISTHAYRLDLPRTMKIHPVFHVSLLEPTASDPLPNQVQPPPPPVIVDGEEEYRVEEILDVKTTRRQPKYLVRWTGYSTPTWEPYDLIKDLEALDTFYERYPSKPRPSD